MNKGVYILSMVIVLTFGCLEATAQDTLSVAARLKAKVDSLRNARSVAVLPDTPAPANDTLDIQEEPLPVNPVDSTEIEAGRFSAEELYRMADSMRLSYNFPAAAELFRNAAAAAVDSSRIRAMEDAMIMSQNGVELMKRCSQPSVVAKERFSIEDFFLYYPLENRSWHSVPNQLDHDGSNPLVKATYIPQNQSELFFSTSGDDGIRQLFRIQDRDTSWTAPAPVFADSSYSDDVIYPVPDPDGKTLYFASRGRSSVGGYDLFMSKWDEDAKAWGKPANMGFPYSSPYDDFLYVNTSDGKYSIFASNRETSRDSVYIYVLEYNAAPTRRHVSSVSVLKSLARLTPNVDNLRITQSTMASAVSGNDGTRNYMIAMSRVRALRDTISSANSILETKRAGLAMAEEGQKTSLAEEVKAREAALLEWQKELDSASKALRSTEMEFLTNGVIIDPDKTQNPSGRDVVGTTSGYTFTRNSPGGTVLFKMPEKNNQLTN